MCIPRQLVVRRSQPLPMSSTRQLATDTLDTLDHTTGPARRERAVDRPLRSTAASSSEVDQAMAAAEPIPVFGELRPGLRRDAGGGSDEEVLGPWVAPALVLLT